MTPHETKQDIMNSAVLILCVGTMMIALPLDWHTPILSIIIISAAYILIKRIRFALYLRRRRNSIKETTGFTDEEIDDIEGRLEEEWGEELGTVLAKGMKSGSVKRGI